MSEDKLKEVAQIAADAVASDDAGELPYYLLGVEGYNRLIDLLVELEQLPESYLREKRRVEERKTKTVESKPSTWVKVGEYRVGHSYVTEVPIDDGG